MFDLNLHFKKYRNNLFFNELSYADLFSDVAKFSQTLGPSKVIALKVKSPYLLMVGLLSLFAKNKIAVLLSPLETSCTQEGLRAQIAFEEILEDHHFNDLLPDNNFSFPHLNEDDPAVVVFSSGTTSAPKGVALSFNNLFFSALGFIEYFNQKESENSLMNLPHNHVGGLMTLWRSFFSGGHLSTNADAPFDFISLVPLQLSRWLEIDYKLSLLQKARVILIGGAPLSAELKERAEKKGLLLSETYGMSESTSLVSINGEVLPYRKLSLDGEGHFIIDGLTVCVGIYQDNRFLPRNTALRTNDLGELHRDRFKFIARSDLVFISGGENINPLAVEEVVRQYPKIADCYLLPVKDEYWGEIGVLLLEINSEPFDEDKFRDYLKKNLHPHHIPKKIFQTHLQFTGLKPKRSELKNTAEELFLKSVFSYEYNELKNAPLMVFLHGFLGDKADLLPIGEEFKNKYSLLYIDLPGHGETKIKAFHSLSDILDKLSRFIKLFDNSPIIYGYSMGGRIALQLSVSYLTPRILFLESAGLGLANTNEQRERKKNDLDLFSTGLNTEYFLDKWYQNPMFKIYRESENFKTDCKKKALHSMEEWKNSQNFLSVGEFPLKEEMQKKLADVKFPIFYIYGEKDLKYSELATHFTHSFKILGAGHNPHKTHAGEIIKNLTVKLK